MTRTLASGCSSNSTNLKELSNEYQDGRVKMVFKNLWVIALWTNVALALEGLNTTRVYKTTREKKFNN